jgi:tripartite-type tricarboxylate transporter receptor subunit TctC
MELFQSMTGVALAHVPYKGGAPALTDLIGGQIMSVCDNVPAPLPYIKSGRMRALGVTTAQRVLQLPDVPTIAESGVPGYDVSSWFAIWAPAGTSQAIVMKLNAAAVAALNTPEVKNRIAAIGFEPQPSTPAELAALLKLEMTRWAVVAKEAGLVQE